LFSSTSIREVAAVEQPREVHDEEHERVWERVATVDVAKGSGVVATRVPDNGKPGRRRTHVHMVAARVNAITDLCGKADRCGPDFGHFPVLILVAGG
jgi:hypothetical protein